LANDTRPNPDVLLAEDTLAPVRPDTVGYIAAALVPAVVTAVGWPLFHRFGFENENVLMLYLLGVLWVATRYSRGAAIVASVLSVAAFDLIFVPPYFNFAVSNRQYVVTFLVMLLTSLVISTLTHRVRMQADAARQRERRTSALFALSKELAVARTVEDIARATIQHVGDILGSRTTMLLGDAERRLAPAADTAIELEQNDRDGEAKELGVAQWAYDHDQPAGRGTSTLPASCGTYVPLRTSRGAIGVLGLLPPAGVSEGSSEQRQLVEAFSSQAALAIERVRLAEEARAAWERVEAEFLRNTLLTGVSHELRTPLASITGAASALVDASPNLSAEARARLLETVLAESERMERLITNLLDMTRLEAGGLAIKREWVPIQEVIGSALRHLDRRVQGRDVRIAVPVDLQLVHIDAVAIEQVLANLIDNAVEYSPPSAAIEIAAHENENELLVEVADHGPGLPQGAEQRVFEKFFRASPGDGDERRGIGLGLAICRGIVEAHGGRISAANRAGGGAVFCFTLPRIGNPPVVDTTA
jgi:two-component system sensor histidine kinase KdpD